MIHHLGGKIEKKISSTFMQYFWLKLQVLKETGLYFNSVISTFTSQRLWQANDLQFLDLDGCEG